MNVKDFTYFLEHPTKVVEPIHTKHLEDIIEEYPYFQAARALHLKGLKNLNSYKYNKALKTTAAYTTDRDVLFEFITSKDFLSYDTTSEKIADTAEKSKVATIGELKEQAETKEVDLTEHTEETLVTENEESTPYIEETLTTEEESTPEDSISINENVISEEIDALETIPEAIATDALISPSEDKPLPQNEHDADQILDPELFQTKNPENSEEEDALDIGKPLFFDAKEKYSFSEWLNLASKKPLEKPEAHIVTNIEKENVQEENEVKENKVAGILDKVQEQKIFLKPIKKPKVKSEAVQKKYDRIDKFIASNPKIVPTEQSTSIDVSKSSESNHNELMTETLARVYLEQKKYKNAIQAYKILSLKYPEKSGFFADRIKAVEKLRKDNK